MLKMKKIYAISLFLFFHSYFCLAQSPEDADASRVEVVKMAYITKELNLSPKEAENFWPVYNNYEKEIRQARNRYPDDEVMFEKKVVEIKERYQNNFKKVLGNNNQRLNRVYTTDRQFNNTLRNELKNRQQFRRENNQQPSSSQQRQLRQQQVPQNKRNNVPAKRNKSKNGSN